MAYPLEQKVQARTLYVEGGLTYDEVAEETGISLSQLKEWGKEGNWFVERLTYERSFLELHSNVQKMKVELSQKALQTKDPQLIYALSNLMRSTTVGGNRTAKQDKAAITLDLLARLLDYLKGRDSEALRYLEPHLRGFADSLKHAEAA